MLKRICFGCLSKRFSKFLEQKPIGSGHLFLSVTIWIAGQPSNDAVFLSSLQNDDHKSSR